MPPVLARLARTRRFLVLASLAGCGSEPAGPNLGSGPGTGPGPGSGANPVTVVVSSASLALTLGETHQLSATVNNATNTAVTWSTTADIVATVSSTGLLSALGVGTATITATSATDPTKAATTTVAVSAPNTGGGAPTLASGVTVAGISAAEDEIRVYRIVVPAGATLLEVVTAGSNGDLDLFLSRSANPTAASQIICASEGKDSNERCQVNSPASGEWFVLLYGFQAFSGVSFTPTITSGSTTLPGYALFLAPTSQSVSQGGSAQYTVAIQRDAGFTSPITFTVTGLPNGVTASFSPNPSSSSASTLTLTTTGAAGMGSSGFTVSGSAQALPNRTVAGAVTVTSGGGGAGGTPAYTLAVTPSSLSLAPGGTTTATVSVTRSGGFTGAVALSASGLPSGVSASFNPSTIAASGATSTVTLAATSSAPASGTTATIRGAASGLTDRTSDLAVTVGGSTNGPQVARIDVTPATDIVYTGQSASFRASAFDAAGNDITAALLGSTTSSFNWTVSNSSVLGQFLVASGPIRATATVYGGSLNGSTLVTATLGDRSGSATLNVRVPTVLTLRTSGTGGGTLAADPSRSTYMWEQVVHVTRQADAYSYFASWSSGCTGIATTCQVTMSTNRTVSATFNPQPWVGFWGGSMTTVRQTDPGNRCTWTLKFSPNSSVTVTYPRDASSGARTVSVLVRTGYTAPTGTPTQSGHNCTAVDDSKAVTLTGEIGSNGSFSLTGRVGSFDATVSSSGLTFGPSAQGQLPVSIALRYNSLQGGTISGSLTTNTSAQPTLQAAPAP